MNSEKPAVVEQRSNRAPNPTVNKPPDGGLLVMSHDQNGRTKWSREQVKNSNVMDAFFWGGGGANSLVTSVVNPPFCRCAILTSVLFITLSVTSGTYILAEEIQQLPVRLIYASCGPLYSEGLALHDVSQLHLSLTFWNENLHQSADIT